MPMSLIPYKVHFSIWLYLKQKKANRRRLRKLRSDESSYAPAEGEVEVSCSSAGRCSLEGFAPHWTMIITAGKQAERHFRNIRSSPPFYVLSWFIDTNTMPQIIAVHVDFDNLQHFLQQDHKSTQRSLLQEKCG